MISDKALLRNIGLMDRIGTLRCENKMHKDSQRGKVRGHMVGMGGLMAMGSLVVGRWVGGDPGP